MCKLGCYVDKQDGLQNDEIEVNHCDNYRNGGDTHEQVSQFV